MPEDPTGAPIPDQESRALFQEALDRRSEGQDFLTEEVTFSQVLTSDDPAVWESFLDQLTTPRPTWTRFEDRGEIARGGMGAIHRVREVDLRRTLAMKILLDREQLDDRSRSNASLGRFLEEAQVTSQLDHPGIVPVHEVGRDERARVYFTMKLVQGEDLRSVFDRVQDPGDEGWNQTRALNTLLRVCEAMAYAHEKGVIHRDLKPGNVMVGRHGETYVMDWGLAKVLGHADHRDLRIRPTQNSSLIQSERKVAAQATPDSPLVTMDGDVVGTPAFMAPEQADGRIEAMGPHSDVYALGAMLYQLLTGQTPYVEPGARVSARTILAKVQLGPPRPIHVIRKDVPAELSAICEKAMARELADRYPTMLELAVDLRAYLENRVVAAYESGAIAELRKWVARNQAVTATVAAAILLVTVLMTWFVLSIRAERDLAEAEKQRVLRLSDIKQLSDLKAQMDGLWPAYPQKSAAMQEWLKSADQLFRKLPDHQSTLAELRSRGTPVADPREGQPTYEFPDEQDAWWHDTLVSLISGLVAFSGDDPFGQTRANVQQRLEFAETIRENSIALFQADWDQARASIADPAECPLYHGLQLSEQLGLVPLGRDPDSDLWEFWHVQTGAQPPRGEDGRLVLTEELGLVFVLIPGGTFWMGAQAEDRSGRNHDPQAESDESVDGSPFAVTLEPFFLSKYELTQAQWQRFEGSNPSTYGPGTDFGEHATTLLHPVEQVSWQDCVELLGRLDLQLPTEAQWEYACRAGTATPWWTGSDPGSLQAAANLADQYCQANGGPASWSYEQDLNDGYTVHGPVGRFRANPFGLHDVIGNVWEWCLDAYGSYAIPPGAGAPGPEDQDAPYRLNRGGSFGFLAVNARSADRNRGTPGLRNHDLGVRPARAIRD